MTVHKTSPTVSIYDRYTWITAVTFKHRWQATLFDYLLKKSSSHHLGLRTS